MGLGERKDSAVSGANNIGAFTASRRGGGASVHLNLEKQSCGERTFLEELRPSPGTAFPTLVLVTLGARSVFVVGLSCAL